MSEPQRLIHDPDLAEELRLSLQARMRSPELPEAIKARVAQRLAATLALPIGADPMSPPSPTPMGESLGSSLTSTTSSGFAASGVLKAVSVTVVGASLSAGVGTLLLATPPKIAAVAPPSVSTVDSAQRMDPRPDLPSAAATGATRLAELTAELTAPQPHDTHPSAVPTAPVANKPNSGLPQKPGISAPSLAPPRSTERQRMLLEANALRAVKGVLESSPNTALRLLDEHARTYPRSQLGVERKVLRLRAHLALGQMTQARQLASALLADPGAALYHSRAQELLEAGTGTAQKKDRE